MKNGSFKIDGVEYQLSQNDFGTDHRHHVHGGYKSFDRLNWNTSLTEEGDGVVFSVLSPHGSEVGITIDLLGINPNNVTRGTRAI